MPENCFGEGKEDGMKDTILWFEDGLKLGAPWQRWNAIDAVTRDLVRLAGHPGFHHRIIDPDECVGPLLKSLKENRLNPSVILDLTGKLGSVFIREFPGIPLIDSFHISRLRKLTSPRLDGCGFLVSHDERQRKDLAEMVDMRRPLILDDVAWSGRSVLTAMRLFGMDCRFTTCGFMVANSGFFGTDKPGARSLLEQKGIRVLSGMDVATPADDGFHVADFFLRHPNLEEAFRTVCHIQKLREEPPGSEDRIGEELRHSLPLTVPDSLSAPDIRKLAAEGRLTGFPGGMNETDRFTVNPPNWLMPSFSRRIRAEILDRNAADIVLLLEQSSRLLELNLPTPEGSLPTKERGC